MEQPGKNYTKTLIVQASSGVRSDGPVDLWADKTTHRLLVDAGTITTSSASVGITGAAVPSSADYIGINSGGNLVGLAVGQVTMANSLPVAIASNQSAVPISAASLPLPSNAAQETGGNLATLAGGITSSKYQTNIAQIGGSTLTIGQQTAANSIPVILPAATITTLTPPSNTGYALDASLTTIDTDLKANITLHAGSNIIGKVTTDQTTHGTTDLVAADITKVGGSAITLGSKTSANSYPVVIASDQATLGVAEQATATGGYTPGKLNSAASTNATSVKASAGKLGWVSVTNINASPRYLKFYNKASAPTVGTDTPVLVLLIPGNANGSGNNPAIPPQGLNFSTGIAFAITTGAADSDTGAVALNDIIVNYGYN